MAATRVLVLLGCALLSVVRTHPHPSTRPPQVVGSSSGQVVNPAVLGSLLTFSQRLADMEKKIKAHDKRILKQEDTLQGLRDALKSKASLTEIENLKNTLQNNVGKIRQTLRLRTMEIERYRNKMREIEGAYSNTETEYSLTRGKVTELEDRFNMFGVACRRAVTGWKNRADGEIMFLDRHHVVCRRNELLRSFVLTRRSDYESALVRYEYRCCRLNL